jgi:hypothetical protein
MLGRSERWYFGMGVLVVTLGFVLALKAPNALGGFAGVVGAIAVPLYGGALGKIFVESRSGGVK